MSLLILTLLLAVALWNSRPIVLRFWKLAILADSLKLSEELTVRQSSSMLLIHEQLYQTALRMFWMRNSVGELARTYQVQLQNRSPQEPSARHASMRENSRHWGLSR